jgi:hypothetical protein
MKTSIFSIFCGGMIIVFLAAGCAGGGNADNDQKAQQVRDAEKLQVQYDQVRGTYVGQMQMSGDKSYDARLSLYTIYVQDGSNPDGTPKVRPSLRGRFKLLDVVNETDTLTLNGDFDALNGTLTLTSATGAGLDVNLLSLRGAMEISSSHYSSTRLEIVRRGGSWGTFVGNRVSMDVSSPTAGDAGELRERLLKVYKKIAGRYSGIVKSTSGEKFNAEINLLVVERVTPSGDLMPALAGQFRRLDIIAGIGERNLVVDYDQMSNDVSMRENIQTGGVSAPGAPAGAQMFSASGTLVNGTMSVTLVDRRGVLGQFVASLERR